MEESSREQGHSKRMNGIHGCYACKMELSEYVSRQQNGEPEKVSSSILGPGPSPASVFDRFLETRKVRHKEYVLSLFFFLDRFFRFVFVVFFSSSFDDV
ncbi:hypothetical protein ACOMHN_047739 [Nucella lapillus]